MGQSSNDFKRVGLISTDLSRVMEKAWKDMVLYWPLMFERG